MRLLDDTDRNARNPTRKSSSGGEVKVQRAVDVTYVPYDPSVETPDGTWVALTDA
jgi:hypothetical protein